MKRHVDQLARESERGLTMSRLHVTRLHAPFVEKALTHSGDLSCVLAICRSGGEQHNYAMKLEAVEVDMMGLGKQDSWREMLPDCQRKEEEVRRKREHAVQYLATRIATAMLNYLEEQDPQFGYSPEQWKDLRK